MIAALASFALFGSFVWLAIIVGLLIVSMFLAEGKENGFIATFAVCVFLGLNYFWGNVPVLEYITWRNVGIYLFVGFLYSVLRTYLFGREAQKEEENVRVRFERKLKGNVFRWWFMFPVSFIFWACSDLVRDIWDWLYEQIQGFYGYIFNLSKPKTP